MPKFLISIILPVLLSLGACAVQSPTQLAANDPPPLGDHLPLAVFYDLMADDEDVAAAALERIKENWKDAYAVMLLDMIYFSTSDRIDAAMTRALQQASGIPFNGDYDPYYRWIWSEDPGLHPRYSAFMAQVYGEIDPGFTEYFDGYPTTLIRLDEVLWGGVNRDGIPPLSSPKMVRADSAGARYLDDDDIVFGVFIDGEARAYPKRILAWHEMVKDEIAGRRLTGVYCTLCGAMILYDSTIDGTYHELGTSGFLYRSNKLMYDQGTQSLWSTLTGEPAIGPLADQGLQLQTLPVVTTTWGEWRSRHPDTLALSLETGRERDYSEGAAYRDYFATDQLMFAVPKLDRRLKNKDEVLALRYDGEPLAISATYLARNPVHQDRAGSTDFVVLTDTSGANRVYETAGQRFARGDGPDTVVDDEGRRWQATESALVAADGRSLRRLPAHRSFWFGWHAQYPQTRLVQ